MEIKIGDVYVRRSEGKSYRVKRIDHNMITLESLEVSGTGTRIILTDIFGLEKAYSKKESGPT